MRLRSKKLSYNFILGCILVVDVVIFVLFLGSRVDMTRAQSASLFSFSMEGRSQLAYMADGDGDDGGPDPAHNPEDRPSGGGGGPNAYDSGGGFSTGPGSDGDGDGGPNAYDSGGGFSTGPGSDGDGGPNAYDSGGGFSTGPGSSALEKVQAEKHVFDTLTEWAKQAKETMDTTIRGLYDRVKTVAKDALDANKPQFGPTGPIGGVPKPSAQNALNDFIKSYDPLSSIKTPQQNVPTPKVELASGDPVVPRFYAGNYEWDEFGNKYDPLTPKELEELMKLPSPVGSAPAIGDTYEDQKGQYGKYVADNVKNTSPTSPTPNGSLSVAPSQSAIGTSVKTEPYGPPAPLKNVLDTIDIQLRSGDITPKEALRRAEEAAKKAGAPLNIGTVGKVEDEVKEKATYTYSDVPVDQIPKKEWDKLSWYEKAAAKVAGKVTIGVHVPQDSLNTPIAPSEQPPNPRPSPSQQISSVPSQTTAGSDVVKNTGAGFPTGDVKQQTQYGDGTQLSKEDLEKMTKSTKGSIDVWAKAGMLDQKIAIESAVMAMGFTGNLDKFTGSVSPADVKKLGVVDPKYSAGVDIDATGIQLDNSVYTDPTKRTGSLGKIIDKELAPNLFDGTTPEKKESVMQAYFRDVMERYTPAQAAGTTGNIRYEGSIGKSILDPMVGGDKVKGKYTARGLAQWRGERLASLEKFAGEKFVGTGLLAESGPGPMTQMDYIDRELQGKTSYKDSGAIKVGKEFASNPDMTAAKATEVFAQNFERPKGNPDDLGATEEEKEKYQKNLADRQNLAEKLLSDYQSTRTTVPQIKPGGTPAPGTEEPKAEQATIGEAKLPAPNTGPYASNLNPVKVTNTSTGLRGPTGPNGEPKTPAQVEQKRQNDLQKILEKQAQYPGQGLRPEDEEKRTREFLANRAQGGIGTGLYDPNNQLSKVDAEFAKKLQSAIEDAEKATGLFDPNLLDEAYRTPERQAQLRANYLNKSVTFEGKTYTPSKNPGDLGHEAAAPGESIHQSAMAVDLNYWGGSITEPGPIVEYIRAHATDYGLKVLGNNDPGHIELEDAKNKTFTNLDGTYSGIDTTGNVTAPTEVKGIFNSKDAMVASVDIDTDGFVTFNDTYLQPKTNQPDGTKQYEVNGKTIEITFKGGKAIDAKTVTEEKPDVSGGQGTPDTKPKESPIARLAKSISDGGRDILCGIGSWLGVGCATSGKTAPEPTTPDVNNPFPAISTQPTAPTPNPTPIYKPTAPTVMSQTQQTNSFSASLDILFDSTTPAVSVTAGLYPDAKGVKHIVQNSSFTLGDIGYTLERVYSPYVVNDDVAYYPDYVSMTETFSTDTNLATLTFFDSAVDGSLDAFYINDAPVKDAEPLRIAQNRYTEVLIDVVQYVNSYR